MDIINEVLTTDTEGAVGEIEQMVGNSSNFYLKLGITLFVCFVCIILFLIISRSYYKYISKLKSQGSFRQNNSSKSHMGFLLARVLLILAPIICLIIVYEIDMAHVLYFLFLVLIFGGISLQDSAKDFVTGLRIMLEHYYTIGDVVEYEGDVGQIISFTFMTTKIQNIYDNSVMSISNRNITQIVRLGNQFDIDIGLSYDEDVDYVFDTLNEIAKYIAFNKHVDDCKFLGIQKYDDSSIKYRIRVFAHPEVFAIAEREANYIIMINLAQKNIKIPYSQIDVHHYNE